MTGGLHGRGTCVAGGGMHGRGSMCGWWCAWQGALHGMHVGVGVCMAGETAEVGGRHPTGMHSCGN